MPEELIHTTTFVGSKRTLGPWKKFGFFECGYEPDGKDLPPEYLIRITSLRNKCTVVSPIQEPIQMKVESRWEPFVPTSLLNAGNVYMQLATRGERSLITKASSRRIWQGSTPMTISINLKFEAVRNPLMEVVEPVRMLCNMALPSDPSGGEGVNLAEFTRAVSTFDVETSFEVLSKTPFLSPPGPTPFTLEGVLNLKRSNEMASQTEIIEGLKGGDKIMVEIGRFLNFYNVIIKEISPTHEPKFGKDGRPISATVNVVFETYEMITVESLEKIYEQVSAPLSTEQVLSLAAFGIPK